MLGSTSVPHFLDHILDILPLCFADKEPEAQRREGTLIQPLSHEWPQLLGWLLLCQPPSPWVLLEQTYSTGP